MTESNRLRVTIGAIDEDGEYRHVFVGMCTRERVAQIMWDILDECGLPVLEIHSRHDRFGKVLLDERTLEKTMKRFAAVSCKKSDRLAEKQAEQLIESVEDPKSGLIVHAYYRLDDVLHNVTGPAAWVQEQIKQAETIQKRLTSKR